MDILIVIAGVIAVIVVLYCVFFNSEYREEKFEDDYENLVIECNINSCSDSEFDSKLEELKNKSGLSEEKINEIINEE